MLLGGCVIGNLLRFGLVLMVFLLILLEMSCLTVFYLLDFRLVVCDKMGGLCLISVAVVYSLCLL